MTDRQAKPFAWKFHPRKEFREWVREQFPQLARDIARSEKCPELESRIHEVHEAAMLVLDLVMQHSDSSTRRYYEEDLQKLRADYKAKDFVAYASHLDSFVDAIEVE